VTCRVEYELADEASSRLSAETHSASKILVSGTQTTYPKETDFIFPSLKKEGRVPLSPAVFVADHLRPAARKAGVQMPDGDRFGPHNLRHSLSHWLVNKANVEPKTVQTIPRHSRIQTTLDIYTQGDGDETQAAQGAFLRELGMASELIQ
jgi:integrase